jgi:hypothetical protein
MLGSHEDFSCGGFLVLSNPEKYIFTLKIIMEDGSGVNYGKI